MPLRFIRPSSRQWQKLSRGVDATLPSQLAVRYRYNPELRSVNAMAPAVIPLLLIFIPAILTALAVVREKELGSIVNLYVTPLRRAEFLLGKQLPYIAVLFVGGMGFPSKVTSFSLR